MSSGKWRPLCYGLNVLINRWGPEAVSWRDFSVLLNDKQNFTKYKLLVQYILALTSFPVPSDGFMESANLTNVFEPNLLLFAKLLCHKRFLWESLLMKPFVHH